MTFSRSPFVKHNTKSRRIFFACMTFFVYPRLAKNICKDEMDRDNAARLIQKKAKEYIVKCFLHASCTTDDVDCPICIDSCHWGIKMACGHCFHAKCITKWLTCERSCPLCRALCEDKRVSRLQKSMANYKEILALPIESLLNFKSAIPAYMLTSIDVSVYTEQVAEKFFSRAQRNKMMIEDSQLYMIMNKWNHLMNIRRDIVLFDKRIHVLSDVKGEDRVIDCAGLTNNCMEEFVIRKKRCPSFVFTNQTVRKCCAIDSAPYGN